MSSSASEMESLVQQLFDQSEDVLHRLQQASSSSESDHASDEFVVSELRSSVVSMVDSYSTAWPQLQPHWTQLQQTQSSLSHNIRVHEAAFKQDIEEVSYLLHHPQHGAATKLRALYEQEQSLELQSARIDTALKAMEYVQAIKDGLQHIQSVPTQPHHGAKGPSLSLEDRCKLYLSLEASFDALLQLDDSPNQSLPSPVSFDATNHPVSVFPLMSIESADFFQSLRREYDIVGEQLRENLMQQLELAIQCTVTAAPASSSSSSTVSTASPSASPTPLPPIIPPFTSRSILDISVHPSRSSVGSLATLFELVALFRASDHFIQRLATRVTQVLLTPLLQYLSEHHAPFILQVPVYFSTQKTAQGKQLRVCLEENRLHRPGAEDDMSAAPCLEANILDVLLTISDFIWQNIFVAISNVQAAAPLPTMVDFTTFLRPQFEQLVQTYICQSIVPRNVEDLLAFPQRSEKKLKEFEQQATQRGLISAAAATGTVQELQSPLPSSGIISIFLQDLLHHFQVNMRHTALNYTRDLILRNNFDVKNWSGEVEVEFSLENTYFQRKNQPTAHDAVSKKNSDGSNNGLFDEPPFYSAANTAARKSALSLYMNHSRAIFSRSHSIYSISQTMFLFCKMLYHLYAECFSAQKLLLLPPVQNDNSTTTTTSTPFTYLFNILRDCIQLYLAISPVYRGSDIESIMHLSFLVYNDSNFLQKHLVKLHAHLKMTCLKPQHSAEAVASSTATQQHLMLVDLTPALAAMGERYFLLHLTRLRNYFSELLELFGDNFSQVENDSTFQQQQQAIKQTLYELQSVEKIWHQLMGTTAASAASNAESSSPLATPTPAPTTVGTNGWQLTIGLLLEYLCGRMVGMVLARTDISEEGASRIHQLFALIDQAYGGGHIDPMRTPSWSAFITVESILRSDQNLASLSHEFNQGNLNSLTPDELGALIRALYQDSAHRQRFLKNLSEATGESEKADATTKLRQMAQKTATAINLSALTSTFTSLGQNIKSKLNNQQ